MIENAEEAESKITEYARVTAHYFQSQGLPYPLEPSAPRYDDGMVPYTPQLVDGKLCRFKPLGLYDRLPPVPREPPVQTDDPENRTPSAYLTANYDD